MHNPISAAPQLRRAFRLSVLRFAVLFLSTSAVIFAQQAGKNSSTGLEPIRSYISSGWNTLSRSLSDCATFSDPKLTGAPHLFLPSDFPEPEAVKQLETRCKVQVRNLPPSGDRLGKPGAAA